MDKRLLFRLRQWRDNEAKRFGVEPYMVLSNKSLEEIARCHPMSRDEFFAISGIKDAKWRRYGASLITMVSDSLGEEETVATKVSPVVAIDDTADETLKRDEDETFSVGTFLDMLNESFSGMRVAIRGEVSGVEERRGMRYFSLKDSDGEGLLSCVVFPREFALSEIFLEDGQEIIVEGSPNIWKPRGRFSFVVSVIRVAGAGACKRAYNELFMRLDREGIFAQENKREIPVFPERIALITSKEGAAIGDFTANLASYGFSISLFDAHVEGKRAVASLLEGIQFFNKTPKKWDVIVLIRGGGSLESLEAYNSEVLVRAVAESKIPVLAGIGHEKDISLVALVADAMVSTPTATARVLSESWKVSATRIDLLEQTIKKHFEYLLMTKRKQLEYIWHTVTRRFEALPSRVTHDMNALASAIDVRSPQKILERGYSILRKDGRVVRRIADISVGDNAEVVLADGSVQVQIL